MRLKYAFETMDFDDRIVAIPVGEGAAKYHGVIKLNETAAFIFNLLQQETDEEFIVEALMKEYSVPQELAVLDVQRYLKMFQENDLLV